jgi:hypothetical protein
MRFSIVYLKKFVKLMKCNRYADSMTICLSHSFHFYACGTNLLLDLQDYTMRIQIKRNKITAVLLFKFTQY